MTEKISVPIDSKMIGEMFLRRGPEADISDWIENVLWQWLEDTADEGGWSEAYYDYREARVGVDSFVETFGNPKEGYHWAPLFLPNGTSIYMEYKREKHYATVKFGKIHFEGKTYSPSEFASHVANNTNRNAWRDLMIKRPSDSEWTLARDLRRRGPK